MRIEVYKSIREIEQKNWKKIESLNFPFTDYEFFKSLEISNSIGKITGWDSRYLCVWENEELLGATVIYLKDNSYGEYIFDWAWADAYHRNGLDYYPKITSAIPYSPVNGAKFLFKNNEFQQEVFELILSKIHEIQGVENSSGIHFLFNSKEEVDAIEKQEGWFSRHSFQYYWSNKNYEIFDDFLSKLKSKRRKEVVRERNNIDKNLKIRSLENDEIQEEHIQAIYHFYLSTISKKYSNAYLTEEFFHQIYLNMKDRLLLFVAEEDDKLVAGSIFLKKGNKLYGRYWGSLKEYQNLHFELCYYRGIDYAIQHKLKTIEAGAQGPHKINRGFLPEINYSSHWIAHPEFSAGINDYCDKEKKDLKQQIIDFENSSPFKKAAFNIHSIE